MLTLAGHLLTVVLTPKLLVINTVDIVDTFPRIRSFIPAQKRAVNLCVLRRGSQTIELYFEEWQQDMFGQNCQGNGQYDGSNDVGQVMALEGDARPHDQQGIKRGYRAPTPMHQPRRRRQSHRRGGVAGRKGAEFVFARNPMSMIPDTLKSLRHVGQRTRAAREDADDVSGQAGDFAGKRDKNNLRGHEWTVEEQKQNSEENSSQRRRPSFAEF